MKKILLLGAMLIGSLCAMAQPYYVAGSADVDTNGMFCNGQNWNPGAEINQLDANNSITFTGVAAGTYEFKVTTGTWQSENWGGAFVDEASVAAGVINTGDNVKFTLPEAGDITIKFDRNTPAINVTSSVGFGELIIKTYTLLGDPLIFGSNFAPADENNDMEEDGDVYTKTYEGVGLDSGIYKYKVVGNHAYSAYEFPGSGVDAVLMIEEPAYYDITFTFDPAADDENKLTYEATWVGEYTPEPVIAQLFIKGDFDEWGAGLELTTTDGDYYVYEGELTLSGGFKIADATWTKYNYGGGYTIVPGVEQVIDNSSQDNLTVEGSIAVSKVEFTISTATLLITGSVATAVEDAIANDEVVAAFDLTGKPVAADAKGVVILQYASGKAAKTVNY